MAPAFVTCMNVEDKAKEWEKEDENTSHRFEHVVAI